MQYTLKGKIKVRTVYPILDQMGQHLSQAQRKLFVKHGIQGESITDLKRIFIQEEQITARQFNSIAYDVKALISAQKEIKKDLIKKTKKKIKKLEAKIKKTKSLPKLHQFKRQLTALSSKLERFQKDLLSPSVCFGQKKLFKKQFYLKENKYVNHKEWKADWELARNGGFFLIGSKDESFGNQSCQFLPGRLKLRLTHGLALKEGKEWIEIPVEFTYHQERILHALSTQQAIHYRFVKKENGFWYVHLTIDLQEEILLTDTQYGALGIDLNPSCIAVTQIDTYGNYLASWQVPTPLRGKTSDQTEAILSDELKKLVEYARVQKVPIVIEKLDFENKKQQLRSRSRNRMLSQFAYALFNKLMAAKCFRAGVELIEVNPAYTSVIGKVKFSHGYGLSSHMGAAMAIARRGLNFGESLRAKTKVRLSLPVRNRRKHVWSDWRRLNPRVFPEEYILWKDRQRPERNQGEKSSRPTASDSARTRKDFGSEAIKFH